MEAAIRFVSRFFIISFEPARTRVGAVIFERSDFVICGSLSIRRVSGSFFFRLRKRIASFGRAFIPDGVRFAPPTASAENMAG